MYFITTLSNIKLLIRIPLVILNTIPLNLNINLKTSIKKVIYR